MQVEKVGTRTSFWDIVINGYNHHVNDWFLMSSPAVPFLILSSYLLFVLKIGPAYMKGKPPYSFRKALILHNLTQVLYSVYLVYTGLRIFMEAGFIERTCMMENKKQAFMLSAGGHLYLMGKLTELLDTVFFVLRKKWNQVSFLHVYHHSIMFFMTWFAVKYSLSHNFVFVAMLNAFVHVIMYTYYGLSAFPSISKYLWWKKYITKLQLVQFVLILIITTMNFNLSVCPTSYFMITIVWSHSILFLYLFSKFYITSYIKNKKAKKDECVFKANGNAAKNVNSEHNAQKLAEKIR